ncbi:MAG: type IV pilin [Candidatus Bathyarchaeota archaeon]|nr:type IV pilin [Candidatus Bathyarchaeota archaeon]
MGTRKNSRKNRSRRAVSPVIATVILVAIAITIAVAVAYWMGGIAGSFTKFEQVEIQTGVCTMVATNWQVQISLKNTGTGAATLTNVFVNDVEVINPTGYGVTVPGAAVDTITTDMTVATAYSLQSGQSGTIKVWIGLNYAMLSPGTTVNIKIHSAGGMDYIKLIELI